MPSPLPPIKHHITLVIQQQGAHALEQLHSHLHSQYSELNISKQALKHYAQQGAVWVTKARLKTEGGENNSHANPRKPERLRRLKNKLNHGDRLDFYYAPDLLHTEPTPPTLMADFEQYSVWIKPRGMLSQGSKWADHTALYRWIEMHYLPNNQPRQCWIVHRLDRATCGLMLIAHSKKMATQLSQLFEQKQIKKCYQANVWREFPSTPQTFSTPVQEKPAISHVQLLKNFSPPSVASLQASKPQLSRVKISIETGRKHQIRTHLSQAGYPIVGDRLYGNLELNSSVPQLDLQLTADQLEFVCPIKQVTRIFSLTEKQRNLYHQEPFDERTI